MVVEGGGSQVIWIIKGIGTQKMLGNSDLNSPVGSVYWNLKMYFPQIPLQVLVKINCNYKSKEPNSNIVVHNNFVLIF